MRDIFPRSQSAFRTNPTNRAYTRIRLGGARSWKPGGEKTRAQLAFGMIINRFPPDLARVQGKPFFCASSLSLSLSSGFNVEVVFATKVWRMRLYIRDVRDISYRICCPV